MAPHPHPLPRWIDWTLRVALLAAGTLMAVVVLGNLWFGQGATWAWGGIKCGDLVQHYGAGLMWNGGRGADLYQDFQLGAFLNQWRAAMDPSSTGESLRNFNYVYAPLVAWISAACTRWDYSVWIQAWLALSLAAYAGAFVLLRLWAPRAFTCDFFTLALFAGFPSFYFALVPGQNTPLTLAIAAGSLLLLARERPAWAGLVFSCAFYKPQIMPAVLLVMAVAGFPRFCAGLVLGNLAWLGLGWALCGTEVHLGWLQSLLGMTDGTQFQKSGMNQSWAGLLAFLPHAGPVIGLAVPALVGGHLRRTGQEAAPALACALATGLASSPYVGYYEVLLGLPWAWWTFRNGGGRGSIVLFYACAWIAVGGLFWQTGIAAPFLTAWLVATLWPRK